MPKLTFGRNVMLTMLLISSWWHVRGCVQKFPDWQPGARTGNCTAFYH